jgi:hypothetical protein
MKIYVSGPITGRPLDQAKAAFAAAAAACAARGHDVVNPFDVPPHYTCQCRHATNHLDGAGGGHDWGCYLRGDLAALLDDCHAIYMLPGWESSHGARLELQVASAVGLQVLWDAPEPAADLCNAVGCDGTPYHD